ncbi:uncharacterized protein LOC125498607 [Beta vulgaris subsp. vulgaris]|uniref:uncharacterized protein LOC125498607 n=1 Tax=Beta vulgaris subsp. vulgaris TaxID=3555 RepID=UPI0020373D2D|nr:uncharacterized protein LOC125498607 [Beta vulgaris subsp. vulgaris]
MNLISINDLQDDSVLSCSSKDEQSNASVDFEASKQDRNAFIEARNKREKWIASVHTPASSVRPMVQPSPFSMQQLVSNAGNSSISGLFASQKKTYVYFGNVNDVAT